MPELPEVETIKKKLAELLIGQEISAIKVQHPKSFLGQSQDLVGLAISHINRKAKIIQLDFSSSPLHLLIHLKMTGQLIYVDKKQKIGGGHPTTSWINDLPGKHTRIIINFNKKSQLFFNDMRIFGWFKLVPDSLLDQEYLHYGPDINDPSLTSNYLAKQFSRRSIPIKSALMMNSIVSGLGNIYASESLFRAGILPARPAKSLSQKEIEKLLTVSQLVINEAIELGGTTFDGKYVHVDGGSGEYQNKLLIYQQAGKSCPNCGSEIKRIKLGGRSSFYCESCQS